jgi:hypothetical protein
VLYSSKINGKRARSDTLAWTCAAGEYRQMTAVCQLNASAPPLGYSNSPRAALKSSAFVMSYRS